MEELRPARRSSTIEDFQRSTSSLALKASLREHAAPISGSSPSDRIGRSQRNEDYVATQGDFGVLVDPNTISPDDQSLVTAKKPFYKKRWFFISQLIMIPFGIALLFILLFPVVRAIAQLLVGKSTLDIQLAAISQPENNSFALNLQGNVAHTGSIPAQIRFQEPIRVSWVEDDHTQIPIGVMNLTTLSTKLFRATIDQNTTFLITDEAAFSRFSGYLITTENFTWRLQSSNLRVNALKFPVANGISFDKLITLKGFASFNGNVVLKDLQLPSDNSAGGINFKATTALTNPSPFSLNLGTVIFGLSYQNVTLGQGTSFNTVINPGDNDIVLSGILQRQTRPSDLAAVSKLFTNYLNGDSSPVIATGLSTLQTDNSTISWLSQGLQQLALEVPFKSPSPINPIRAVTIGNLNLGFSENSAWSPSAESNTVQAALQLPFGFNVAINDIKNDFNIVTNGGSVVGLSTPLGVSQSSISVLGPTLTKGTINITINTNLSCPNPQHLLFSQFNANLTSLAKEDFLLIGNSSAVATTGIGQITLNPIKVNAPSSLNGLSGLRGLTSINSVDVMGGTQSGINLGINVSIFNPSSLDLATGDLTLKLLRQGTPLGTALLPNLTLRRGNNTLVATSNFEANSPQGQQTLNDFVGKKAVELVIAGYNGSTKIASLAKAFETLNINITLPGLTTSLISQAALEVLPTTGHKNNISHVTVSLANPFSSALEIRSVSSTVKSFGLSLGTINSTTKFTSPAKSTTESPSLDLNMNFDPAILFTLTRALAVEAGLDVSPFDGIAQLGGITYLPITGNTPPIKKGQNAKLYSGFNLPSFVQTAFKKLRSDVDLAAAVTIGNYQTTLEYTQPGVPIATDHSLGYILPMLAGPIVQKIVSGSVLGIANVIITDPRQTSFGTRLNGSITNAGPFDAVISFPSGLTVSWAGRPLGSIKLGDVPVTGDVGATINAGSTFQVADVAHLTDFTKTLLTEEFFDWEISGENLTVSALGISVPGIGLASKTVKLKGFNGLKNGVHINSFDLPSNDAAGGIHLNLGVKTTNPSQVGISLSSIGFNTFVGDIMIAPVSSVGSVTLAPESSSELALVGRLVPQNSSAGLAAVSRVFNNFVNGIDSNVEVHGASAGSQEAVWLNQGIQALKVATVLPNRGALSVIKSINLSQLELIFTDQTAYRPLTSSDSTEAAFQLPFGFPIDIVALEQTLMVGYEGAIVAQLALPKAPTHTDINQRIINLSFNNVPFAVLDNEHSGFDSFVTQTTLERTQIIHLSGSAKADAKTAVGLLSLQGISFSVDTSLEGLQGLNAKPVTVGSLDVKHGFADSLLIKVNTSLFNPSNLTIGTGDVSFLLEFQGQAIGTAVIDALVIQPGNKSYATDVFFAPRGAAVAAGRTLLQDFLQGIDVNTAITGTPNSTSIQSLKSALSHIHLSPVTIPALHQTLIKSTSLTFPLDIVQTGVASASFVLDNPFTASINLLKVGATATFHGISLGKINNVDISLHPLHVDGHSSVTSPALPFQFNLQPLAIIQLLSIAAQENKVNLGPLPLLFKAIIDNPNFKPPVTTAVDTNRPTCVSGLQFDVAGAVLKALAGIKVDLAVESNIKIDDFATDLSFGQHQIPAITDKTALFLIGAIAGPVAQGLVDRSSLQFTKANITNISNDGFDLSLAGSLTNVGPLDALIEFTEGLTVTWDGRDIAHIQLPPVCATANKGVPNYNTNAHLTITDNSAFTSFASSLLHEPSFEWTVSTRRLRLTALGTVFSNVSLSKIVTFKAFNNLPGVTISNFKLPSDDPEGGILIKTDALIPSAAQLGIDLGTVTFKSFFRNTYLGPLSANSLFLAANSKTVTHLSGRINPQVGADLDNLGILFSGFLAGENQTLVTKGDSVQPPSSSGPVTWLSEAFKTLSLEVTLPGQKFNVIQSITLNDLSVTMQSPKQAFAPPSSSKSSLAQYKNPFGFSLQVVKSGQEIVINAEGVDIAQLVLPKVPVNGGVSTGNLADLQISFSDVPLTSLNLKAFALLFAAVTLKDKVTFNLKGNANVTARTTVGDIPISGIPFNVPSSLNGINSLQHTASLTNVSIVGSGGERGNQHILSTLTASLKNPSSITLNTVSISLPVMYQKVALGRAVISPFNLKPGENRAAAEFHYQPDKANDTIAQQFLSEFIQTGNRLDLVILGDGNSSPFASLNPGLAHLLLGASLSGLNHPNIITHIYVSITHDTLITNRVETSFDVQNPLDQEIIIQFVQTDAGLNGKTFAQFSQAFSFAVPPHQTVNSGTFGNVLLTQGVAPSIGIIPAGVLDVAAAATIQVGKGGYTIPWLHLNQKGVPTSYRLPPKSG